MGRTRRTPGAEPQHRPDDCGTAWGYSVHYEAGEFACEPCLAVRRAMSTTQRRARGVPVRGGPTAQCGTASGYSRHRRAGEAACESCKAAEAERARRQYHEGPGRENHRRYYEAQNRKPGAQDPREPRTCPVCWETFTPNHGTRKYCDDFCASLATEMARGRGKQLLALRLAAPAERAAMVARIAARRQTPKAERKRERYGKTHWAERKRRLAELDPEAPCPRCLQPLGDDPAGLDLDHDDDDPSQYLGLAHRYCNRARLPVLAVT